MLRLIRFVTRKPGIVPDRFAAFRRDELGPLVAGLQTRLHVMRYVQTHRDRGSEQAESLFLGRRAGATNNFDGIEEYWWADEEACSAAMHEADGPFAAIDHDLQAWIDAGRSPAWFAIDFPQVATSASRLVAVPGSGLLRLVFAISPLASLGPCAAQRYWLMQHGPLVRGFAAARGTLAYNQVHRLPREAEAALRGAGWASRVPYMGHAEAWLPEAQPAAGCDAVTAQDKAVDDERRFIDWTLSSVVIGKELVFVDRNWC